MIGLPFTSIVAIMFSLALGTSVPAPPLLPPLSPTPQPTGTVTFQPDTNSVLDPDASLSVLAPAPNAIATLHTDGGSQYYIWVKINHPGFALDSITPGIAPCEASTSDSGKGDGQHVYVFVDKGPARIMATGDSIKIPVINYADSGPHTVCAIMCRSWDESLKDPSHIGNRETDLYCVRTFYIDTNNGAHEVDSTVPLLILNAPLETFNYGGYPSNHVAVDFDMMFKKLPQGYKIEATLTDSTNSTILGRDTLTQWVPYCITGLPDPTPPAKTKYILHMRLLNTSGTHIANGARYDLNDIAREFYVHHQ